MMFVIYKTYLNISRFVVWRSWTDIFKKKLVITGLFLKFCTLQCDSNVYIYINSYPPSCPHHQVKISIAVYGGADPGVITQELLPQYLQKITDALSPY